MKTIVIKQQFLENNKNKEEIMERFTYFLTENIVTTLLIAGKISNKTKLKLKDMLPGIEIKTLEQQEEIKYDEEQDSFEVLKKHYYLDIGSAIFMCAKKIEIVYFDLLSQYNHKDSFTLEYLSEQITKKISVMKKMINAKKLN
ncbi:MAG: hypothetical protein RR646_01530 [Erysipelotrichaceae bacterium]